MNIVKRSIFTEVNYFPLRSAPKNVFRIVSGEIFSLSILLSVVFIEIFVRANQKISLNEEFLDLKDGKMCRF